MHHIKCFLIDLSAYIYS
uniref:Uncharacterized protein n=1 Tax=Anguilla anguilla TaxID=7936 RepID=A0A0E9XD57_ANGAN